MFHSITATKALSLYQSYNEHELFRLIAEGDEGAFNHFYSRFLPQFVPYVFRLVKSEYAVNEVIQETLLKLWINRDKISSVKEPRFWFFKIVANECYRYLQKNKLQEFRHKEIKNKRNAELEIVGPEHYFSFKETKLLIHEAVLSLSPQQQRIYRMSREEGMKLPEIAETLNLSRDYVKKVLMRALYLIRENLVVHGKLPLISLLLFFC